MATTGFHTVPRILLAAALGLAAWAVAAGQDQLPVPEEAAQKTSTELVRNIFKGEYEAAKTPQDRLALASKMLKTAGETKGDSAGRYALLIAARDLAAADGDLKLVQSAVAELGKSYRIDELALLHDALAVAAKSVRDKEVQSKVAQLALSLTARAEAADRYLVGRELGETALDAAREIRDVALIQRIQTRMDELEQLAAAHRQIEEAGKSLLETPTDPEANLAVGKFYGFLKGQWEKGIPMLALGSDPRLQELAKQELQGISSAEEQAAIGDAWWEMAETAEGLSQQHLREHAAHWYVKAAPKLTGLRKAAAEKRIADSLPSLEDRPLPDGAVLVFNFEEKSFFRQGNALFVRDLSGEGNHGLVSGAQPARGKAGTALSFDGKKAYVECRNAESLNPTAAFTICAWINARTWRRDAIDYVVSKDDWKDDPRGYVLRGQESGRVAVTVGAGGWRASPSKERLATGAWHHLAATLGGGQLTLYVNAIAKNTVPAPTPVIPSPYLLRVGRGHFADERGFDGVIDEVAIFNRALSSDEIKTIYEMGAAGANLAK
jgi:hypothetical protein